MELLWSVFEFTYVEIPVWMFKLCRYSKLYIINLWKSPYRLTQGFLHSPSPLTEMVLCTILLGLGLWIAVWSSFLDSIPPRLQTRLLTDVIPLYFWSMFMLSASILHLVGLALSTFVLRIGLTWRSISSFFLMVAYMAMNLIVVRTFVLGLGSPLPLIYNLPLFLASFMCHYSLRYATDGPNDSYPTPSANK